MIVGSWVPESRGNTLQFCLKFLHLPRRCLECKGWHALCGFTNHIITKKRCCLEAWNICETTKCININHERQFSLIIKNQVPTMILIMNQCLETFHINMMFSIFFNHRNVWFCESRLCFLLRFESPSLQDFSWMDSPWGWTNHYDAIAWHSLTWYVCQWIILVIQW